MGWPRTSYKSISNKIPEEVESLTVMLSKTLGHLLSVGHSSPLWPLSHRYTDHPSSLGHTKLSLFQALAHASPPYWNSLLDSLGDFLLQAASQLFFPQSCLPSLPYGILTGSLPDSVPLCNLIPFISLMVLTSICDVHGDKLPACLVSHYNPGAYSNECFLGWRNIQDKRETKNEQDIFLFVET